MKAKDFLSIADVSSDEIEALLDKADEIKAHPERYRTTLAGQTLAMIFQKPSTRTRVSFEVGMWQLGGYALYLSGTDIQIGRGETIADTARVLSRYCNGIMARVFGHKDVEDLGRYATVPVINGLSDLTHPCQAMADYMTILEIKKDLKGIRLAYVGDGNNVAHSLIFAAARLGVHIAVATPAGYEPDEEVVRWADKNAPATGAKIEILRDPVQAVSDADVVYTDVWASMGQEDEAAQRRRVFEPYQVNEGLFELAKKDAIFMHCLPAHRGDEVTDGVIDSPRSVVFQQAENRLHAQKAILLTLMG